MHSAKIDCSKSQTMISVLIINRLAEAGLLLQLLSKIFVFFFKIKTDFKSRVNYNTFL